MSNQNTFKENAKMFAVAFLNCIFQGAVMALGAHAANKMVKGYGPRSLLPDGNVTPLRKVGS